MNEIELKFLVPTNKLNAIKRQTHIKSSIDNKLSAHYFDTQSQQLAKNGIAIRIRQEIKNFQDANKEPSEVSFEQWIQTFKTSGDGIASHLEHNHLLDTEQAKADFSKGALRPDLNLYANTPISKVFQKFSNKKDTTQLQEKLTLLYSTDVQRTTRLIEHTENDTRNIIEVAFDTGEVCHLAENGDKQSQPLQEIEFELLKGDTKFLFDTAKIWCKRYNLCLSTVTKAERGGLVMANKSHPNAVTVNLKKYRTNALNKKTSQPEFLRAVVHNCLLQILPNSSAIIGGVLETGLETDSDKSIKQASKHIHQLRVGIRRLRTALQFFADFSEQVNPKWLPILKETFSQLGQYRDREILITKTQPMLEKVGSPSIDWTADLLSVKTSSINAVESNDFQLTLLELIEFTMSDSRTESNQQPAKPFLTKTLNKLFANICKVSSQFSTLEIDAQHDVRKHLKALRYISEFSSPMYSDNKENAENSEKKKGENITKKKGKKAVSNIEPNKSVNKDSNESNQQYKQFIKHLKPAQEVLGDYNDSCVAYHFCIEKVKREPKAYFAVGWFVAQQKMSAVVCTKNLQTISDLPIFWK